MTDKYFKDEPGYLYKHIGEAIGIAANFRENMLVGSEDLILNQCTVFCVNHQGSDCTSAMIGSMTIGDSGSPQMGHLNAWINEYGIKDEQPYFATFYANGTTLNKKLRKHVYIVIIDERG